MTDSPEPLFSFVVAVYNVEQYLPEFLASIGALDIGCDDLEVIFVDDGSQDGSAALVAAWITSCRFASCLLHKDNGGPGSARNAGLPQVRGRWVSFPDPDDVLDVDYLRVVAAYVGSDHAVGAAMIAARPIRFVEDWSSPITPHPLDPQFADVERLVDLEQSSRCVQLHTITGFYRTDLICAHGLRFDEEVRPIFEDAVFNVDYLTHAPRPTVAFLRGASYFYRKRAEKNSLTSRAWQDPAMFGQLPEKGYLALLERSRQPIPRWIQNTVYYDLQWFFKADAQLKSNTASLSPSALERFQDLLTLIIRHLDETTLLEFHAIDIPVRIRLGLVARKTGKIPSQNAFVTKLDSAQRIMQISYFSTHGLPAEEIRLDGTIPISPIYAKSTTIQYFDRTWLYQRDLWVPSQRRLSLRVDGRLMPISYGAPAAAVFETVPREVWQRYAHRPPPLMRPSAPRTQLGSDFSQGPSAAETGHPVPLVREPHQALSLARERLREQTSRPAVRLAKRLVQAATWSSRLALRNVLPVAPPISTNRDGFVEAVRRRSASPAVRRRFRSAWVLIDRDSSAQDNAEAFYRYLSQHHPEVNAWFALSRTSPDWVRLERAGARLIEFDSIDYACALRNASYLISSQADHYLTRPRRAAYGPRTWRFVFLQHGVIHNDLSRWLNGMPIHIMITTTAAEHDSIVANDTPYLLSAKEVVRTGLPRHDRLLAMAGDDREGRRRSILVTPTWRDYLVGPQSFGHDRSLAADLAASPFLEGWREFLCSPDLVRLLDREGLDLVFLAHPNLQKHLAAGMLPEHVHTVTLADVDIQEVIASAAVMVTDYSSIAFDAAYIETPVIYYQFDAEDFFSGRHTVRPGAFSYHRDGFGPVVTDAAAAVDALTDLVNPESKQRRYYKGRMSDTFTFRDGQCCARVLEAIRRGQSPHPHSVNQLPDPAASAEPRDEPSHFLKLTASPPKDRSTCPANAANVTEVSLQTPGPKATS
jgi:glycosyltransferase involved in cell wall biosynthesis